MFRKSPDLCYTRPPQKLSNIGNCPRGGSQNSWQTNTSLIEWRQGKGFWDATNSVEKNFFDSSLLEIKLECTWMEKSFELTRGWRVWWRVDEDVGGKLFRGRHKKFNTPANNLHWEEWWLCRKIAYMCTNLHLMYTHDNFTIILCIFDFFISQFKSKMSKLLPICLKNQFLCFVHVLLINNVFGMIFK